MWLVPRKRISCGSRIFWASAWANGGGLWGVTLSVAVLYLMMTPSVYTRSAAVMIKDNSKGGSASVGAEEFADLGLFKNSSNVYNELQTMKSPALMEEVVSRLGLNETFTVKEGLKPRELYK